MYILCHMWLLNLGCGDTFWEIPAASRLLQEGDLLLCLLTFLKSNQVGWKGKCQGSSVGLLGHIPGDGHFQDDVCMLGCAHAWVGRGHSVFSCAAKSADAKSEVRRFYGETCTLYQSKESQPARSGSQHTTGVCSSTDHLFSPYSTCNCLSKGMWRGCWESMPCYK